MREAKVAVSPGVGFGEYGDSHVRIALVENKHRIRQAVRNIKAFLGGGQGAKPAWAPRARTNRRRTKRYE